MVLKPVSRCLALFFLFSLVVIGCEGLAGPENSNPIFIGPGAGETLNAVISETGNVRVLITDGPFPFDLVENAFVSVVRVDFLNASGGIVVVYEAETPDEAFEIDLVTLRDGITTELAHVDIPAGEYQQIRVIVGENAQVVLKDGQSYDLKIPSGSSSGIKIKTDFTISDEMELTDVILDFPLEKSFIVQGNPNSPAGIKGFLFKPVIHLKDDGGPEVDEMEVEGAIEALNGDQLTVGGVVIKVDSNTRYRGFDELSDLQVGNVVEVEYIVLEDGSNLAWKIKIGKEDRETNAWKGKVTVENGDGDNFLLSVAGVDTQFIVNNDTVVDDDLDLEDLVGKETQISVEIEYYEGGENKYATKVKMEDED